MQTLLDATNQCVTQFMRGKELAADDDKGRALFVYLASLSPDASADTLPLTVVQNIVDMPSATPGAASRSTKRRARNCHGEPHTGNGRMRRHGVDHSRRDHRHARRRSEDGRARR